MAEVSFVTFPVSKTDHSSDGIPFKDFGSYYSNIELQFFFPVRKLVHFMFYILKFENHLPESTRLSHTTLCLFLQALFI